MHFHLEKLAVMAALAIGGVGPAYAQNAVGQLQPLVETTAHRLMIGEQVALAKWDSGKVVEDTPREAQVILGAMKDGVRRGWMKRRYRTFSMRRSKPISLCSTRCWLTGIAQAKHRSMRRSIC
jgi:hypothetical protein